MSRRWLLPLLILFLAGSLYQLDLPGLHYDEAFEVVPALQILTHQPVNAFRQSTVTLFGLTLPLTTQDYIGAVNTAGTIPFLALGGFTVFSLRSYAVAVGLLTLMLVYGFTATLTRHKTAGLAAVALLAVNPTFIFWSRQGIFVTAINAGIGVAAAWSWLVWWRTGKYRWAALGAFLFGLGLYAKLLFIWLIVALAGAFVLAGWIETRQAAAPFTQLLRRFSPAGPKSAALQSLSLLAWGALGCWPLLLYNLQTGGTFKSVTQNAATSYYGVNNADFLANLATRISQFVTLLTSGQMWYLGAVHPNPLLPAVFAAALGFSLWLAVKGQIATPMIPFAVMGAVVIESIVTVSALWPTHFALIMVWPAVALAATGREFYRCFPGRRAKIILALALAVLIATDGYTTWQDHRALTVSGGLSDHSDAIYDLASWLDQNAAGRPVVAMDWGLAASVTFLTAGRVTPIEVFGYDWATPDRFEQIIRPHLLPQQAVFLWRAPDEVIFDRSGDFKALYGPLGLEETILEAFYEQSGRPLLGATELVPLGSAGNKPK